MFSEADSKKLSSLIEGEIFISFFSFKLIAANGKTALTGLCKVAKSPSPKELNYMSATLIFDTPTQLEYEIATRLVSRLNFDAFKRSNPEMQALTSLKASLILPSDHYVHQFDMVFKPDFNLPDSDGVNSIAYALRHGAELDTEKPIWWDDNAPAPSEVEKQNWTARIKALLGG